jgi:Skp family chaperone for outer membrane proteins
MTKFAKFMLLAAAPIAAVVALPTVASAQATSIGVANLEEAVQKSNAFVLAINQIKITYKAQIDAFEARSKALNTEIQPLVTAFQTAQRAPNANQAALQTQYTALQTRQQNANKELQTLYLPVGRAQAFAEEQIVAKLDPALKAAMTKKKVALVLQPNATVSYQPVADITTDIVAELNTAVPNVSITPPANWQPGGQQGQAGAPAAPGAPAQPAKPQPQGR